MRKRKKYSECCAIKISICGNSNSFRGFMQEFDKLHNTYKKMCLHPNKSECSRVKTHAHTISQKAVLELIAENGIVLMPIVFGIRNEFRMEPRGIEAKATKFYCFCSNHDKMFAPIDYTKVCLGNRTADTESAESSRLSDAELGGNIYPEEKYHHL